MGMLDQVKKIEKAKGSFTIIYGGAGVGKTTMASTYPKPMLYISLNDDGGMAVLEGVEGVDTLPHLVTDEGYYKKVAGSKRMIDKLNELLVELYTTQHDYATLVIDPFSFLADEMEVFMKRISNKKALNFDDRSSIQSAIHPIFERLRKLSHKMNVVCVCHDKVFESKDSLTDTSTLRVLPAFTQSTSNFLCKYADDIIYLTVRNQGEEGEVNYKRIGIVGCNPILGTKVRLPLGKSLDGIDLLDLSYEGLERLKNEI